MLPIYVINLGRRPERLARIGAELDAQGLAWERIVAIDAAAVDIRELRATFGGGWRSRAFPATPGDMACSLTHQRLWRRIAESGEAAVVLEDDAVLGHGFANFVDPIVVALMREAGLGVLKLEHWPGSQRSRRFPWGVPSRLSHGIAGSQLFRLRSSFLGTCAYVMRPEAAELSRVHHNQLCVPVDHYLFGREAGLGFGLLQPGFVNPAPVRHGIDIHDSDIASERGDGDIRRSGVRRFLDAMARWQLAGEFRRNEVQMVEMAFSGAGDSGHVHTARLEGGSAGSVRTTSRSSP